MKFKIIVILLSTGLCINNAFACSPPAEITSGRCLDALKSAYNSANNNINHQYTWLQALDFFSFCSYENKFPQGASCVDAIDNFRRDMRLGTVNNQDPYNSCGPSVVAKISNVSLKLLSECLNGGPICEQELSQEKIINNDLSKTYLACLSDSASNLKASNDLYNKQLSLQKEQYLKKIKLLKKKLKALSLR